jgi:hypothetical protein
LGRRPRACIWAFYEGNDLQDVIAYESYQRDLHWILPGRHSEPLYGRSLTRNVLALAIRHWLRPEPRQPAWRYTGQFVDSRGRQVPMYFPTGVQHGAGDPPLPREEAPELDRVRSVLAEAHALCRRQGVALVVMFIPSKFRVYRRACTFEPDSPCLSWPVDDLPRALARAVAAVAGDVRFFDLTPRLQAEAAGGTLLYLPDDPHWTAQGHCVAAQALADFLRSTRMTDASPLATRMRGRTLTDARDKVNAFMDR